MTETISQQEDDAAFAEFMGRVWPERLPALGELRAKAQERTMLRLAFDAGMKRREEKRGCCTERGEHD